MNRKFLILFSLLIVAIGISGILLNPDKEIPELLTQTEKRKERNIVLAQTRHDLTAGTLISKEDYSLQNITVDESSDLVKMIHHMVIELMVIALLTIELMIINLMVIY